MTKNCARRACKYVICIGTYITFFTFFSKPLQINSTLYDVPTSIFEKQNFEQLLCPQKKVSLNTKVKEIFSLRSVFGIVLYGRIKSISPDTITTEVMYMYDDRWRFRCIQSSSDII